MVVRVERHDRRMWSIRIQRDCSNLRWLWEWVAWAHPAPSEPSLHLLWLLWQRNCLPLGQFCETSGLESVEFEWEWRRRMRLPVWTEMALHFWVATHCLLFCQGIAPYELSQQAMEDADRVKEAVLKWPDFEM